MARIRTVKPELAAHEGMFDLEEQTGLPVRFAWVMLFTVADREGRFAWRPRTIKAQTLPHDLIDFSRVLDAWLTRGFIIKYRVGNEWFGVIPTFTKHQVINNRETKSDLPDVSEADEVISHVNNTLDACDTRQPREDDACGTREVHALGEGRKEGREGKGKEGKENSSCAAPTSSSPAGDLLPTEPASPTAVSFLLNDGKEFPITEAQVREFGDLYPGIDVLQQLRAIKAWTISNPKNRKTRTGAMRFVNAWLSRAQNSAPTRPTSGPAPQKGALPRLSA